MLENKDLVKEKYAELCKKYELPDFEKINQEFELEAIDLKKSGIFINAIIRVIHSRLQQFLGYLDQFLVPQPSSAFTIFIFKGLTSENRKKILDLYKEIAILYQYSLKIILSEENEKVEFINHLWKKYPCIKSQFIIIVDELKDIFLKEEKKIKFQEYMG